MVAAIGIASWGCSTRPAGGVEFGVQAAEYERAIEAARDVLLEARFEIDRVDASAGVVTTLPKGTGGLLTPWDAEQTTMQQEWQDATSTHQRRVRVTFEPAAVDRRDPPAGQAAADVAGGGVIGASRALDLRRSGVALTARVEVYVDRVRRVGTRLESESIRRSTWAVDPALVGRGMSPSYTTTVDRDDLLAARLVARIRERLGE